MADNRKIPSLKIEGFRAFESLVIRDLSDVNLLVGRNNVGKTSVLEALQLYFSQGERQRYPDLLVARSEYSLKRMRDALPNDYPPLAFEALFFGRPKLPDSKPVFRIGPVDPTSAPTLEVSFAWLREVREDAEGVTRVQLVEVPTDYELLDLLPGLQIRFGERHLLVLLSRLDRAASLRGRLRDSPLGDTSDALVFLPSTGLDRTEIGRIWDTVALTEDEDEVIRALRVVSNLIEKLVLVQSPASRLSERTAPDRIMMVKLAHFQDPVPFMSLGEGINHFLGIFLALIKARGGVILIDEVENGIHYSVQPALWKLIFKQAAAWNIQVFATTHSWDCVEGFQIAASDQSRVSASLFRLESRDGKIEAIPFSPEEVEIARRESIEVR